MIKFARLFTLFFLLFFAGNVFSQDSSGIKFTFDSHRLNDSNVVISIKGKIDSGLRLFALQKSPKDALYSTIQFDSSIKKLLKDSIIQKGVEQNATDPSLHSEVYFFKDSVEWQQKISASLTDSFLVKGNVNYMVQKGDDYIPGETEFKVFVLPEKEGGTNALNTLVVKRINDGGSFAMKSLWWIFIIGFLNGLGALITPCVFSMIPVTVSFFTKKSTTRSEGKKNAVLYSTSIIAIFTFVGFLITLIWGATALNNLATNWIANLIFFLLFLIFGISFLGAFEITLPSAWTNKADSKSGTGSFIGIFFMALVLVLVSFSCTGPFIGNLLPIIGRGGYFGPLVGFFSFSLALSLPFSLFAFFPNLLSSIGKPGGWLNAVKVTMGFIELALALKFLSNADLSKGWRLLDREVFLSLWIVVFILLGIYLLGKIKFHHDDELPKNDFGIPYLSVTRLFFAIASFSFAVYMIPGMWGAPLKSITWILPPMGTQDFNISASNHTVSYQPVDSSLSDNQLPHPVKYYDRMRIYEPEVVVKYGMVTYFDYDEALSVARKVHKPLMLDFTGINCVNCRKMEGQVWSDPEVMKRLKNNFVIVSLYVDVQNIDLQPADQYYSKSLKKEITTLGDKNADLQVSLYNANTQPYYFFLDANENRLEPEGYGYDSNADKFKNMLDDVVVKYKAEK